MTCTEWSENSWKIGFVVLELVVKFGQQDKLPAFNA